MVDPEDVAISADGDVEAGVYETGLYLGRVVLAQGRWWAVLHRFDSDGAHAGSEFWDAGPDEDGAQDRAGLRLTEMAGKLPGTQRQDITVRAFSVSHAGIEFGT